MGIRRKIRKAKNAKYSKRVKSSNKRVSVRRPQEVSDINWSDKKTLIKNYKIMGITVDPNLINNVENENTKESEFIKDFKDQELKNYPERKFMDLDEQRIVKKMMEKYDRDFIKMEKNVKINKYYWTSNQIERKFKEYQDLLDL